MISHIKAWHQIVTYIVIILVAGKSVVCWKKCSSR